MGRELEELLARSRNFHMSPQQNEEQRRSFAYGTAHIENDKVTRDTVTEAARILAEQMTAKRD